MDLTRNSPWPKPWPDQFPRLPYPRAQTKAHWSMATSCFWYSWKTKGNNAGAISYVSRNTTSQIEAWPADKAGLLRCALNGTQFTNDALTHSKADTDRCPFCDQKDSLYHRHAECKHFESERGDILAQLAQVEGFQHPVVIHHGWIPKNPYKRQIKHILLTKIQQQAFQYELPEKFDNDINILDLFTDGSAIYPTNGTLRIATWGVVVWTGKEFWPLSSGGVQGYHQTSLRGEFGQPFLH